MAKQITFSVPTWQDARGAVQALRAKRQGRKQAAFFQSWLGDTAALSDLDAANTYIRDLQVEIERLKGLNEALEDDNRRLRDANAVLMSEKTALRTELATCEICSHMRN